MKSEKPTEAPIADWQEYPPSVPTLNLYTAIVSLDLVRVLEMACIRGGIERWHRS
jgi:hypothetical protein